MSFRIWKILVPCFVLFAMLFLSGCKVNYYLVKDNVATAKIVVPRYQADDPDPCANIDSRWQRVCRGAQDLQTEIAAMTAQGVVLTIEDDDEVNPLDKDLEIHLGETYCRLQEDDNLPFDELTDDEAFFIEALTTDAGSGCTDGVKIFISGKRFDEIDFWRGHGNGTRNGVFEFLEAKLGVSYFLPGPLGKEAPEGLEDVTVDNEAVLQVPSYKNRMITGFDAVGKPWAIQNKMHHVSFMRWQFYHNITPLLQGQIGSDLSAYHPDIWVQPTLPDGTPDPSQAPYILAASENPPSNLNYQPKLDPDQFDTYEHVAQRLHWYTANDNYESVSMGLMDSRDYHAPVELPKHHYRYNESERDVYGQAYNDVNRNLWDFIVRTVNRWRELGDHENQWVCTLAYNNTTTPPPSSIDLPHNLIVLVGGDRTTTWLDNTTGGVRDVDRQYLITWAQRMPVGGRLALGEKYWGAEMFVPRFAPGLMAESLRWAYNDLPAAAGREGETIIDGLWAEGYPIWPFDGPKFWVAAKLLWNAEYEEPWEPMFDFCEGMFGDASVPMKAYFDLLEDAWSKFPIDYPDQWLYHSERVQRVYKTDHFEWVPYPINVINNRDEPGILRIYRNYMGTLQAQIDTAKAVFAGANPKPMEYYRILLFERGLGLLTAMTNFQETSDSIEDAEIPETYAEAYAILEDARVLDAQWPVIFQAYDTMVNPPSEQLPAGVDDDELGEPRWGSSYYENHLREYMPAIYAGIRLTQTATWFTNNGNHTLSSEVTAIYNRVWNSDSAIAENLPQTEKNSLTSVSP